MARERLTGIDMARGLALMGMLAVHFGPKDDESWLGRLYSLPHGRASILFVIVAGVGMALLSGSPEKQGEARLRLFLFALVLLPLGLTLQLLDHGVAVILQHYSAMFLLGAVVLGLERRYLFWLAVSCSLVGPLLYYLIGSEVPGVLEGFPTQWGQPAWYLPLALTVAGPYPLLSWAAPVSFGLWIGRLPLREASVQCGLLVGGAVVAALAAALSHLLTAWLGDPSSAQDPRQLVVMYAHSEMPLWVLQACGAAAAVLGGCLLLARGARLLAVPFAALGRFALTAYVAHLVALHIAEPLLRHDTVPAALLSVLLFSAVMSGVALVWESRFARGPVEYLLHAPWQFARGTLVHSSAKPAAQKQPARSLHDPITADSR